MKTNLKKIYYPLTEGQRSRGVVFSSTLIKKDGSEMRTHELTEWDENTIERLKNDSFFTPCCAHNIIRK